MKDLVVDFNQLLEVASTLERIAGELKDEIQKFDKTSNEIYHTSWMGEDQKSYFRTLDNKYKVSLGKIQQNLYDYAMLLQDSARVYKTTEDIMREENINVH